MKTALITGASGGIGEALAWKMAGNDINLVLVARSEEKLKQLAEALKQKHKVKAEYVVSDLAQPDAPAELFTKTESMGLTIDYLVNNAGFGNFGLFAETEWEKEAEMIQLNISALTALTKYYVQPMVQQKSGRILNVASTAAFQPGPLMAVYYATKAYVLSFSEALANELAEHKVTVTALCPGPTKTGFADAADMAGSNLFQSGMVATAKEVAEYGYRAMMAAEVVAIPGVINKLMAKSVNFLPRKAVTALVRKVTDK